MYGFNQDAAKANVAKGGNYLKAGEIHKVSVQDVQMETIDTKNGPAKVLKVTIADKDGAMYEDTFFEPNQDDFNRRTSDKGRTMPSNWEHTQNKLMQYIYAFRRDLYDKILAGESMQVKTWDDFRKKMVNYLTIAKDKGTETNVKMVKNKAGYASTPGYTAALNKDGEVFTGNKFLGEVDEVAFTDWEITQMQNIAKAAPTNIGDDSGLDSEINDLDSLDLDSLDALGEL